MKPATLTYVLITPARNEAALIGKTIQSVTSQTILPLRWVIVSDGSTDGTDEIVKEGCRSHEWIDYVRMPERDTRHFAAKVACFNAGLRRLKDLDYDILGNLDADISFGSDYMEFLLNRFASNPDLGVAGTPFVEEGKHYDYRFTNIEHVSGACQLFRKACFDQIGGYVPIPGGGIDWTAVTTARMKGWKTRTFTETVCHHHRKMGTGHTNALGAWFRHGKKDYFLGGHPLWQVFRMAHQMKSRPYVAGGILLLIGYAWAAISGMDRPVSADLMEFHRKEQMDRLRAFLVGKRWGGEKSRES